MHHTFFRAWHRCGNVVVLTDNDEDDDHRYLHTKIVSTMTASRLRLSSWLLLAASSCVVNAQDVVYGDRWNYDETIVRSDGFTDYGPSDWGDIECDESSREGLDACLAYTDKWHEGEGWTIRDNYCRWCPESSPDSCGRHHQSPINLERNRGLGYWNKTEENNGNPGANADPMAKECIDQHWMKYEDAWCPLDQLIEAKAFTIERHALRISQPITVDEDDVVSIDCFIEGKGSRFGRIDFSKGFSQWWFLSHIDIHVTSEHTQEGKKYDAELQMHHFYSVNASVAGVDNELATVAMFMQAYDNVPPYPYLDKIICQWRRAEYETRMECGMEPIETSYPGCFPVEQQPGRKLRHGEKEKKSSPYETVHDLILAHDQRQSRLEKGMDVSDIKIPTLKMEPENWGPPDRTEEEWAEFIALESKQMQLDEELWKELHQEFNGDAYKAHEEFHDRRQRRLIEGDGIKWFNYWPMLGVRTEYYFRYAGTTTTPPCYGTFVPDSRTQTNNWRVMKDPIRIHPHQLAELKRLIRDRIAPKDSPVRSCRPDTAAKVSDGGNEVDTSRPVQYWHPAHFLVFCECKDWPSKWPEDREWCAMKDPYERFYDKPYGFDNQGF